jgi:nucleoside-diphosphate-sugar epimerase
MSERVLLAGCGDLGERVARRLLARGDAVFALRRHPSAGRLDGITWLAGDMTQGDLLPSLPRHHPAGALAHAGRATRRRIVPCSSTACAA